MPPPHLQALAYTLNRQRGVSIFWVGSLISVPFFLPALARTWAFAACATMCLVACGLMEFWAWYYSRNLEAVPLQIVRYFPVIALARNGGMGLLAAYEFFSHGITNVGLLSAALLLSFALGATVVVRPYWTALVAALSALFLPPALAALWTNTTVGYGLSAILIGSMINFLRSARADHQHFWERLHDARALQMAHRQAEENGRREAVLLANQARHNAVLAERNRIAGEWHDSLLATLSGAATILATARERIARTPDERDLLQAVMDALQQCRTDARLAIGDLMTFDATDADLAGILHRALVPMLSRYGAELEIHTIGAPYPAGFRLNELLRILQEAANNAVRHGSATKLTLTLTYSPETLHVSLADNGKGFTPVSPQPAHYGITLMNQRAQRLGAMFLISSEPEKGAVVDISIPNREPSMGQTRVLLVEDHHLVRLAVKTVLSGHAQYFLAGEAGTVADALLRYDESRPDLTILDLRLPDGSGLTVLRHIRASDPKAQVLVLSNLEGSEHIASAMAEGALGYVFKDSSPEELLTAIETVSHGRQYLARRAASVLNQRTVREDLTPRELDVLELLVRGFSNQAIADALGIAEKTVRAHMTGVLAKLQATDRTHAALIALQQGFVEPPANTLDNRPV